MAAVNHPLHPTHSLTSTRPPSPHFKDAARAQPLRIIVCAASRLQSLLIHKWKCSLGLHGGHWLCPFLRSMRDFLAHFIGGLILPSPGPPPDWNYQAFTNQTPSASGALQRVEDASVEGRSQGYYDNNLSITSDTTHKPTTTCWVFISVVCTESSNGIIWPSWCLVSLLMMIDQHHVTKLPSLTLRPLKSHLIWEN